MALPFRIFCGLTLIASSGILSLASAAEWGSIEGQFVAAEWVEVPELFSIGGNPICPKAIPDETLVIDRKSLGVAHVFVYLRKAPVDVHPDLVAIPTKNVVSDRLDCRFQPHSMLVRTGQTVSCTNSDQTVHNVRTNPVAGSALNFNLQPKDNIGQDITFELSETLPVKVSSDIHSWMTCYWLVLDHPYMAVTDAEGKFKIENLPAGEHTFRVWHERQGYLHREYKVTVTAGQKTVLPVETIPVAKLKKK